MTPTPSENGDVIERLCQHIFEWGARPGKQYLEYVTASDLAHSIVGLFNLSEGSAEKWLGELLAVIHRDGYCDNPARGY